MINLLRSLRNHTIANPKKFGTKDWLLLNWTLKGGDPTASHGSQLTIL